MARIFKENLIMAQYEQVMSNGDVDSNLVRALLVIFKKKKSKELSEKYVKKFHEKEIQPVMSIPSRLVGRCCE